MGEEDDELGKEGMVGRMSNLRRDCLAKAMNLSIHMEIINADCEEEDQCDTRNEKDKATYPNFGRLLKFLMRPKPSKGKAKAKSGNNNDKNNNDNNDKLAAADAKSDKDKPVPGIFQGLKQFEADMTLRCQNKNLKVDHLTAPTSLQHASQPGGAEEPKQQVFNFSKMGMGGSQFHLCGLDVIDSFQLACRFQ
jgi:hypothetical protein